MSSLNPIRGYRFGAGMSTVKHSRLSLRESSVGVRCFLRIVAFRSAKVALVFAAFSDSCLSLRESSVGICCFFRTFAERKETMIAFD